MARIKIKPIEPLEIEFADGMVVTAIFSNFAFAIFEDEFGSIEKYAKDEGVKKPYDFVSKLLYCGVKANNSDFTLDEAKRVVCMGGTDLLGEIMTAVFDNLSAGLDDEQKSNFQKEVNIRLASFSKTYR